MQKSGLVDTMWDLVVDAGGAFVASLIGYFHIKLDRGPLIKRILRKFLEKKSPAALQLLKKTKLCSDIKIKALLLGLVYR